MEKHIALYSSRGKERLRSEEVEQRLCQLERSASLHQHSIRAIEETILPTHERRIRQLEQNMSRCQAFMDKKIKDLEEKVRFLCFLIDKLRANERVSGSRGRKDSPTSNCIQTNYTELAFNIKADVRTVVNYLFEKQVLSDVVKEDILRGNQNPYRMAHALLDTISGLGNAAHESFYNSTIAAQLWSAADLLQPENAPHHQPVLTEESTPQQVSGADDLCTSGLQSVQVEGLQFYSHEAQIVSLSEAVKELQTQMALMIWSTSGGQSDGEVFTEETSDDGARLKRTFSTHQDLVKNHDIPVGLSTYVELAALEQEAKVENGPAFEIGQRSFPVKFRSELNSQRGGLKGENCTPQRAVTQYILKTSLADLPDLRDAKFYLVESNNQIVILAISKTFLKILDPETKVPSKSWPIRQVRRCSVKQPSRRDLTLEFHHGGSMMMYSNELKAEEIADKINNYIGQSSEVLKTI